MGTQIKNGIVEDLVIGPKQDYVSAPLEWDIINQLTADVTTTGQTLTDVVTAAGVGMFSAILAGGIYEIEAVLQVVASADTNGMEVGINCTQTPVSVQAVVTGNTATTTGAVVGIVANATATAAFNTSSAGVGLILIKGIVVGHATVAGNLSVQFLKVTSGTATVKKGSLFKLRRLV